MAKIRKYKLSWKPSESRNIAGYRVYWSEGNSVDYDSKHFDMFNITKLNIFDEVLVSNKPVMFGVTAVDFDGNESDIALLPEPFQVTIPEAPKNLSIGHSDRFTVSAIGRKRQKNENDNLAEAIEATGIGSVSDNDGLNDSGR